MRRRGGRVADGEDRAAASRRARRGGQGWRVDVAVYRRVVHPGARGLLMLALAPRVLRGDRRVRGFQAAGAFRLLRGHARGAHQHRADGALEIQDARREPMEQTRSSPAHPRLRAPRHARPDQARPARRRSVDRGEPNVSTRVRSRGRALPVGDRRDVPPRHVRRVRVPHLRRAVERGRAEEAAGRVEASGQARRRLRRSTGTARRRRERRRRLERSRRPRDATDDPRVTRRRNETRRARVNRAS